eukprot:scaffold2879_cov269-Prasinococcus_capsulatus_cf.AAC.20
MSPKCILRGRVAKRNQGARRCAPVEPEQQNKCPLGSCPLAQGSVVRLVSAPHPLAQPFGQPPVREGSILKLLVAAGAGWGGYGSTSCGTTQALCAGAPCVAGQHTTGVNVNIVYMNPGLVSACLGTSGTPYK